MRPELTNLTRYILSYGKVRSKSAAWISGSDAIQVRTRPVVPPVNKSVTSVIRRFDLVRFCSAVARRSNTEADGGSPQPGPVRFILF